MAGKKPLFSADAAEEYFSTLLTYYRNTGNDIFKRDNEGRHVSDQIYSAEYQKYLGMQIAMREVLEYFAKFELVDTALRQEDHFREVTKKVEPLTLDELRQMPIRDWVWIEILNPDAFRSKETVSAYYRKYDGYKKAEIFWCGYPGLGFGFDYVDYGKTWLAYRQKPEEGTD